MKNAPFAYQSQTGEWSIFMMNVENVSLKTESQSYKSLTKLKLMKTFISFSDAKIAMLKILRGRISLLWGNKSLFIVFCTLSNYFCSIS